MNPLHGIVQSRRLQLRSTYSCTQAVERRLLTCLTTSKLPQSSLYGLLLHSRNATAQQSTAQGAEQDFRLALHSTAQQSTAQQMSVQSNIQHSVQSNTCHSTAGWCRALVLSQYNHMYLITTHYNSAQHSMSIDEAMETV